MSPKGAMTPAKCRYCRAERDQKRLVPVMRRAGKNKVIAVCASCLERNRRIGNLAELSQDAYVKYCRMLGLRTPEEMALEMEVLAQLPQPRDIGARTDRIRSVVSGGLPERRR